MTGWAFIAWQYLVDLILVALAWRNLAHHREHAKARAAERRVRHE